MRNLELYKVNYLLHKGKFSEALDLVKNIFADKTGKDIDYLFFCDVKDISHCKNLLSLFLRLSGNECRLIPFSSVFSSFLSFIPSASVFHLIYSHDFYERTVVDNYGLHKAFENPVEDYEEIIDMVVSLCLTGFVNSKNTDHVPDSGQIIINQTSLDEYYVGKWPEEFKVELIKRTEEACKHLSSDVWQIRSKDYFDVNAGVFLFTIFDYSYVSNDVKLFRIFNFKHRHPLYLQYALISLKKCLKECSLQQLDELVLYTTGFENTNGYDFLIDLIEFLEDKNVNFEKYLK
jgi:hypothetical protein